MSHELRTPLNSLLILAKLLSDNNDGNLTDKQVEYAKTIYASGGDLLALINEILDLSKVEAGKMQVEPRRSSLSARSPTSSSEPSDRSPTRRGWPSTSRCRPRRPIDQHRSAAPAAGPEEPARQRVQVHRDGGVSAADRAGAAGWTRLRTRRCNGDSKVVAFSVVDTGIGIPKDKQKLIFEAFQQADGTTSRKYGGTGLGLSISREIARLLGGEIQVESRLGEGSTFTLYLPALRRATGCC